MKYFRNKDFLMRQKGFTLMEMLIFMTVISILFAASVPLITQLSKQKASVDNNVLQCIKNLSVTNPDGSSWYSTITGNTSIPTAGTVCNSAVTDTLYNRGQALSTALWSASQGNYPYNAMALRIIRAACDQGGTAACDYFISSCRANGSGSSPYCDDLGDFGDFTDLGYYLRQNYKYNTNPGATYIYNQLSTILLSSPTNLVNEVVYACSNNHNPDNYNDNLNTNIACQFIQPWFYIQACNQGSASACTKAHDLNYNKSCNEIKTNWPTAATGIYNLTYNGAGSTIPTTCNMTNFASASITGCDNVLGNTYNADHLLTYPTDTALNKSDDCYYAYNNNYNTSCDSVTTNWTTAPAGTHNLTSGGTPPSHSPVSTSCAAAGTTCIGNIGAVCTDGTIYAGNLYGTNIFTTPADCAGTYKFNDGSSYPSWNNAIDLADGAGNFVKLLVATNTGKGAPYAGAQACQALNTANAGAGTYGHTDWFLPAKYQLALLDTNKSAIGGFTSNTYLSSTEANLGQIFGYNFNTNVATNVSINIVEYVRCVRTAKGLPALPSPLVWFSATPQTPCNTTAGTRCTDGTIFVAHYNNRDIYTTPTDLASTYTWNNGTTSYSYNGAADLNYGVNNETILKNSVDVGSPYNAVVSGCESLNVANSGAGTYGHNDWYLPSYNELYLFSQSVVRSLDMTQFALVYYWTSTETDSTRAQAFAVNSTAGAQYVKNTLEHVRCIRSQ